MICPECDEYSYKEDVCVNCGLVIEDRPIISLPRRMTDKTQNIYNEFYEPLSPNIIFSTICQSNTNNRDLNRILNRDNHKSKKTNKYYYLETFIDINRICNFLQLRNVVRESALNIYKSIINIDQVFFRQIKNINIGNAACICVACDINNEIYRMDEVCELIKTDRQFDWTMRKLRSIYMEIKRIFNFPSTNQGNNNYISYVGNKLKLPQDFISKMHKVYFNIKRRFKSQFLIKGYILALFSIYGKQFGITMAKLEKLFNITSPTIANRRKEIIRWLK